VGEHNGRPRTGAALRAAPPGESPLHAYARHPHLRHSCGSDVHQRSRAFYSAIDAGRENRHGYTPEHANALEYLLYTRPILGELAVVSRRVLPTSIMSATTVWLENGTLVESDTEPNGSYIHADTMASSYVPDDYLPNLLLPREILASEAGATGSCAMSC
jgi:hypothetical protein